jgi:hypothetical protein
MFTATIILMIGIAAQTLFNHLFGQTVPGGADSYKVSTNHSGRKVKSSRRITRRIARRAVKSASLVQV